MKIKQLKKKTVALAMAMALTTTGLLGNFAYAEDTPKTLII